MKPDTAHQEANDLSPDLPGRAHPVIPVALDPAALPIAVAGRGQPALRRFRALSAAGATDLLLFTDQPDEALRSASGPALRHFLPSPADIAPLRALWIAGLPDDQSAELAAQARVTRVLVNVEDRRALC